LAAEQKANTISSVQPELVFAMGTFMVAPLELRRQEAVISRLFCSLVMEGGAWTAGAVADESWDVGACMGEEMDEVIDVHTEMVGVSVCKGAGIVSGAGMSSNETLLLSSLRVCVAELRWIKQLAGRHGLCMEHRECLVEDSIARVSHMASGID